MEYKTYNDYLQEYGKYSVYSDNIVYDPYKPTEIDDVWARWFYVENKRIITHRLNGPAIVKNKQYMYFDRLDTLTDWYCHNVRIEKWMKINNIDPSNVSETDILFIKTTFGALDVNSTKKLIYNL